MPHSHLFFLQMEDTDQIIFDVEKAWPFWGWSGFQVFQILGLAYGNKG